MLGNDVVDLGDAETREDALHPRFDTRVFAVSELAQLAASPATNHLRWSLWAAKEATYKLGVKRDPALVFSPRRFVVALTGPAHAVVTYPGGSADVRLRTRGASIHAVATQSASGEILADVLRADASDDASRAVRELARERVAERLGVAPSALRLGARGRIPTLEVRDSAASDADAETIAIDLSLSHHGRYLAFACEMGAALR